MSPFHLQLQPAPDPTRIDCLWLGASALRPEGSLTLPLGPDAAQAGLPGSFAIDLAPLLAELAAGLIPDAKALAQADDLLPLRDLLGEAGLAELCEALYPFLWRAARTAPLTVTKSAGDDHAWADPDRRLLRVWFATNRKLEPTGDPVHLFSDEASAEDLTFGRCTVLIPKSYRPGSTGTPWWRRWVRLEADDTLELRSTQPLPEPVFWVGWPSAWPASGRPASATASCWSTASM